MLKKLNRKPLTDKNNATLRHVKNTIDLIKTVLTRDKLSFFEFVNLI
jgi:hypothetical protein